MATQPPRPASVGEMLNQTFSVLRAAIAPSAAYVAVFSAIGSLLDHATASPDGGVSAPGGAGQLGLAIISIVALYLLMETMLREAGLRQYAGGRRYLAFLGQGIAMVLGVAFGLVLLIVPGVILAARWALAQPLLVGRGQGVFAGLGQSWEMTRGHAGRIFLAGCALFLLFVVGVGGLIGMFGEGSLAAIVGSQIAGNAISVLSSAFMVALLGLLSPVSGALEAVFE